jgi:hypothetical protein
MPAAISMTAPADNSTADRGQALALAWAAVPGDVYVKLEHYTPAVMPLVYPDVAGTTTIRCFTSSQNGGITIPASLLTQMIAGGATLSVFGMAQQRLFVGSYDVFVRLSTWNGSPLHLTLQ